MSAKRTKLILGACLLVIVGVLYFRFLFSPSQVPLPPPGHTLNKEQWRPDDKSLTVLAYIAPPNSFLTKNGRAIGSDIAFVRDILLRMGYEAKFVHMPFKRILGEMKNGNYPAMLTCVPSRARSQYLYFSDPVSWLCWVFWKPSHRKLSWQNYDDLKGLRVGASPYLYNQEMWDAADKGLFTIDVVRQQAPDLINFRKLMQHKIDLFVCDVNVGLNIQHTNAPEFGDIDYMPKPVGPIHPFCFALSREYFRSRPDQAVSLMKHFNRELASLIAEGKHKEIYHKYRMVNPKRIENP